MCRNHIKLGAFWSCKRELCAGLCFSSSFLVPCSAWTTQSPPLLHVLPWREMWGDRHGNIPSVTLQEESHHLGETPRGISGII